ncbi:MAG: DNA gyrase subunit A [Candidatus Woesearchaeota archaeon]
MKEKKENIKEGNIEDEMKSSYLDYAMSVIVGRALPDVKDGLKPVHRRILYTMHQMKLFHSKQFKKSARVVGDVLGKYHPHGDAAVYDALVRMAQPFSMRYPLIDGQGNFGSIDGDSAAAMRYTEVRLSKIAEELLKDIEKETVDFGKNFDNTLEEPLFLPSRIPNLLLNGSSGIAVGMATNIPPHNLSEVFEALARLIDNPEMSIEGIMSIIKGPDFPTGGLVYSNGNLINAYKNGRGQVIVRARTEVESKAKKNSIIITEIPFQVNKSLLLEEIANLVKNKTIEGISDIRDESDKEGVRIVISLKQDVNPEITLNQLFHHTKLQTNYGIIMLCLVEGKPRILNIKELLLNFIDYRKKTITRALNFDLRKAKERVHIVEGLVIALKRIDEVIAKIKQSGNIEEAKNSLMNEFGLSEKQALAILEMKLQRLSRLEFQKTIEEKESLLKTIEELNRILGSENEILKIMKKEFEELKNAYGDKRRTDMVKEESIELDVEDLIKREDVVITLTNKGYIKRTSLKEYRTQNRGGRGLVGTQTREEDFVKNVLIANTHSWLLFFTDKGRFFRLKVYKIPETGRNSKGRAVVNLLELEQGENITALLPIEEFNSGLILMATSRGTIKKSRLSDYFTSRNGVRAILLEENDKLIGVDIVRENNFVILATKNGFAARFKEDEVRTMGRVTRGVCGIKLKSSDEVVGMVVSESEEETLLTTSENGFGKRTYVKDYRLTGRAVNGVINLKVNEKTGKVVALKTVNDNDEIILITKFGYTIRLPVKQISVVGRNTQGVRLIKLEQEDKVVGVERIRGDNKLDNSNQEAK